MTIEQAEQRLVDAGIDVSAPTVTVLRMFGGDVVGIHDVYRFQYGRTDLSYNRAAAEAVCDAFRRALYHGQGPPEPQEVS